MTFTLDQLQRIATSTPRATLEAHLEPMNAAMLEFGITTRLRQAAFIAQMLHESAGLTRMVETLNYSGSRIRAIFPKYPAAWKFARTLFRRADERAIANIVYGGRLGNTAPNDGWDYRGHGPTQLTGKGNYIRYGKLLDLDLVGNPSSVADPKIGWRVAGLYWKLRGINKHADRGDIEAVTRAINGGTNGLEDRIRLYRLALSIITPRIEQPQVMLEGKQLTTAQAFRDGVHINSVSPQALHVRFTPPQFDIKDRTDKPTGPLGRQVIADGVNITGRRMVGVEWVVNATDPMNVYIRRRVHKSAVA